jgi:class 3 adenylate cyclase
VEAVADAEHDHVQLVGSTPLADAANLCVPVVQTVARRRAAVILADAIEDAQFGNTPDVRARRPRSIACIPILQRDRLLGVLYVENNLARAAFSTERVRLLTLMASELAVAVERVRLAEVARESSVALSDALRRVGRLEKSREHLGKFVPRSVQRIIDANPDAPALEKRERDVSILFLDIEGYTRLTESLPRERLDWLVRTYFSRFLDIVHEHRGEINETAGDGLMILFQDDVPSEHAANACRAAVAIRRAARELNASFAAQLEPVTVNIGINSGAALVGSTRLQGSGDARWTFTATGSVTNVAARLGAFATGGSIVVSDATATRIGAGFVLESLGPQRLKNVSEPVVLFRISDEGVQT